MFDTLTPDAIINKTASALRAKKYNVIITENKSSALAELKKLIPAESDVMTGGSKTLDEIGFTDLLKSGTSGWVNWKENIFSEPDKEIQAEVRKESSMASFYLASAHALTEDGIIIQASGTGSQLPAFSFLAGHAVYVVGAQKIVSTEAEALKRVREYVLPLEDARQKSIGNSGSQIAKLLITYADTFPNRITVILVKEKLGF